MINRQSSRSTLLDSDWFCSQLPFTHKLLTSSLDLYRSRPATDRLYGLKRFYWRWLKLRAFLQDYREHWLAPSYSQEGEDLILRRLFNGQGNGFFVDIGAHHPKRFSNTYYFYMHGWCGINVDAAPGSMEEFKKVRPRDINLEAAIANGNHTLTYYEFSEPTLNGFSREISLARDQNGPYKMTGERPVRTVTLAEILDQHLPRGQRIDFLTIDVEGFDLEVLKSNDWSKYKPTLILVEDLTFKSFEKMNESPVVCLLRQHGYELYCKAVNTLVFRRQGRLLPYEREAKFEERGTEMRLAYIVTAHKYPAQLARLIDRLNGDGTTFFVHVDKKTDAATYKQMVAALRRFPNVCFLQKRFPCYYMTLFGAVQAQLQAMREIFESGTAFDYLLYVTGQDYPIKSKAAIEATLQNAGGKSFICHFLLPFEGWHPSGGKITQNASRIECWHFYVLNQYIRLPRKLRQCTRLFSLEQSPVWFIASLLLPKKRKFPAGYAPHGGWAYWCLSQEHAAYVDRFAQTHPDFVRYFRFAKSADEIFFQTVLLNSPFKEQIINDDLRFVDWGNNDCTPRILRAADLPKLAASSKLFARKFDATVDETVLDLIDDQLLSAKPVAAGV